MERKRISRQELKGLAEIRQSDKWRRKPWDPFSSDLLDFILAERSENTTLEVSLTEANLALLEAKATIDQLSKALEEKGLCTITLDIEERTYDYLEFLAEDTGWTIDKVVEYILANSILLEAYKRYDVRTRNKEIW
jgi:hypothetical protein